MRVTEPRVFDKYVARNCIIEVTYDSAVSIVLTLSAKTQPCLTQLACYFGGLRPVIQNLIPTLAFSKPNQVV